MKKYLIIISVIVSINSYSLELPNIFSKTYKSNWTQIEDNYFIDTNSVVKNKMNLSSAVFKSESRERAKIVGVAFYDYTAYGIDVDCRKKELNIKYVYDVPKMGDLIEVKANGIGEWVSIDALAKNAKLLKAYERLCK